MMFAHRDLPEGPIGADEIYGPNMAVRTSILDQGFRFDEKIGPNAEDPDYPTGGETDFAGGSHNRVPPAGLRKSRWSTTSSAPSS